MGKDFRITLDEDMEKAFDEIREFYNLKSRAELFRLMVIRFYNFVKEEKLKGRDKFSI